MVLKIITALVLLLFATEPGLVYMQVVLHLSPMAALGAALAVTNLWLLLLFYGRWLDRATRWIEARSIPLLRNVFAKFRVLKRVFFIALFMLAFPKKEGRQVHSLIGVFIGATWPALWGGFAARSAAMFYCARVHKHSAYLVFMVGNALRLAGVTGVIELIKLIAKML